MRKSRMLWGSLAVVASAAFFGSRPAADAPGITYDFALAPQAQHVHSSSIVELPGGDLFAVWYRGSGERRADDVLIEGARFGPGREPLRRWWSWGPPLTVADTPGFPDCNPIAFVDERGRLTVIWPAIIDNNWESALLRFRSAPASGWTGTPAWNDGGVVLLKPDDLRERVEPFAREVLPSLPPGRDRDELQRLMTRLSDKLYNRLGWMPRTHVTRLPSGRLLLPLYSDTYNLSLVAISDDQGSTWKASHPIVSLGGVQPSLVRKYDGTIVAWMRDNGPPPQRAIVATSADEGMTWTRGEDSDVPNPGSSLEVIALRDGSWLMVNNDTESGRERLSAWVSLDEGRTWPHRRVIEDTPGGSYSYPSVLQARDGRIHVTYSYVEPLAPPTVSSSAIDRNGRPLVFPAGTKRREAIRHASFDSSWVRER